MKKGVAFSTVNSLLWTFQTYLRLPLHAKSPRFSVPFQVLWLQLHAQTVNFFQEHCANPVLLVVKLVSAQLFAQHVWPQISSLTLLLSYVPVQKDPSTPPKLIVRCAPLEPTLTQRRILVSTALPAVLPAPTPRAAVCAQTITSS